MGIKDLWTILAPYCERKSLQELCGKTVAIDLAGWVCESQCVVDYSIQPRFYLRNLFFRTCFLLLFGVRPVFVLDGQAPSLKHNTIAKRNELQFRGAPAKDLSQPKMKTVQGRTQFNHVLKQCEELLKHMGLECIQAPGEAEAYCAFLNRHGYIDGIISQDSDCFAYGAQRVYKNFSLSMQGKQKENNGAVDVYDLENVQSSLDLGQNKIVALALFCGCDYLPDGVPGIGRDSVMKYFSRYSDSVILNEILNWPTNSSKFNDMESMINDKDTCTKCGHKGKLQSHTRKGCESCGTDKLCMETLWKEERVYIKNELQIRSKALSTPGFPSLPVIDEFKTEPDKPSSIDLSWKKPNIHKFIRNMCDKMQWEEIYSFQKFLPLLTRWQLLALKTNKDIAMVEPNCIKKKRTIKGVPSYEVFWKDEYNYLDGLIPEDQLSLYAEQNNESIESLWTTIEPSDDFENAYPLMVKSFLESKIKPVKRKTKENSSQPTKKQTKSKTSKRILSDNNEIDALDTLMDSLEIIDKPKKKPRQSRKPAKLAGPLEKFLQRENMSKSNSSFAELMNLTESINSSQVPNLSQILDSIMSRTPELKELNSRNLQYDKLRRTRDDSDLFIKYNPPQEIQIRSQSFEDLGITSTGVMKSYDLADEISSSTPNKASTNLKSTSEIKNMFKEKCGDFMNVSYFFDDISNPVDAFAMSMDDNVLKVDYQSDSN